MSDQRLNEVIEQAAQIRGEEQARAFRQSFVLRWRLDQCESPIEQLLAVGLELYAFEDSWGWEPQIEVGEYRADFMVWCRDDGWRHRQRAEILVEADGHDFHEKTKDQARHDKKRDRYLQSQGFYVLRFTGSEIHKDPLGCAREAYQMAFKAYERSEES